MPVRDLSPSAWVSPGTARLSLNMVLTALTTDRQAFDDLINSYSPTSHQTVNWGSGANTFTIPDTTNARFIVVVMPYGNTTTAILKWNLADTGKYVHPQGFYADTFDPNHMPTTLYITTGAAINGVTIIVF